MAATDAWVAYIIESEARAQKPVPAEAATLEAATYLMQGMGYATAEDASGVTVKQIETGHELFPKSSAAKALVTRTIRDIEIEDDAAVEAKKVVRRYQQLAAQRLPGPVTPGPSTATWIAGSSASSPDSPQVSVAEREGVMDDVVGS